VTEMLRLNMLPHTAWVAIIRLPTNILSCRKELQSLAYNRIRVKWNISH